MNDARQHPKSAARRHAFRSRRWAWSVFALMLLMPMMWLARGAAPVGPAATRPAADAAPADAAGTRFVPVDVYVDTGTKNLAAYQLEVIAKDSKIVGLEGGEPAAFKNAPYYDPAALQAGGGGEGGGGKIIVAAFSTAENLPNGLTRVARLHLMVNGPLDAKGLPQMTEKLTVATDAQGQPVDAKLSLRAIQGETK